MRNMLIAVVVGLLAWIIAGRLLTSNPSATSAPTIEQLKPLAELLTHRIVVTDALTVTLAGYTGDLRVAVIVRGDAILSVDLTQARIEQIDHDAKTAVVVLPPPHVVMARLDHRHTNIFAIEASGLWALVPADIGPAQLVDQAMREAQAAVHRAASEPNVMDQARTRAAFLVCTFMADSLGWFVETRWIDRPDD